MAASEAKIEKMRQRLSDLPETRVVAKTTGVGNDGDDPHAGERLNCAAIDGGGGKFPLQRIASKNATVFPWFPSCGSRSYLVESIILASSFPTALQKGILYCISNRRLVVPRIVRLSS